MKKFSMFLLLLCLVSLTAVAGELPPPLAGWLPNEAGGKIMFLTDDTTNPRCAGPGGGLSVLSYNKNNDAAEGCWSFGPNAAFIKVIWNSGGTKIYDIENVTMTDEYIAWVKASMGEDNASSSPGI